MIAGNIVSFLQKFEEYKLFHITIKDMENSMKIITKFFLSFLLITLLQGALSAANYKIVVLPFDKLNKEKNAELDTLTVGISETLSGALSTVDNFVVIDSNRVKRHLLESAEFKQAIGVEASAILKNSAN